MATTLIEPWHPPAVTCTQWCEYQDGHPNELHRDDQNCVGPRLRVDLTRHPGLAESYYDEDMGWRPGPDHIHVYARQNAYETEPCIDLVHEASDQPLIELRFTPDEARQLIENIQLVLGQIGAER